MSGTRNSRAWSSPASWPGGRGPLPLAAHRRTRQEEGDARRVAVVLPLRQAAHDLWIFKRRRSGSSQLPRRAEPAAPASARRDHGGTSDGTGAVPYDNPAFSGSPTGPHPRDLPGPTTPRGDETRPPPRTIHHRAGISRGFRRDSVACSVLTDSELSSGLPPDGQLPTSTAEPAGGVSMPSRACIQS